MAAVDGKGSVVVASEGFGKSRSLRRRFCVQSWISAFAGGVEMKNYLFTLRKDAVMRDH